VCQLKDLDVDTILDEIQKEIETSDTSEIQWDTAALPDLIDHILATYHRPLDEELPRLEAMARKVHAVHLDKAPETLSALLSVYLGLKEELDQHMVKEELDLFPMIKQGKGPEIGAPVCVMLHEHDTAAHALTRLRELTDDYQVPEDACNTWRALWHGLAALETSLHEHIHLENNILFPRALKG
ncbi:MAG: iron-sulfur cluster repair di-iron protein, partial [Candidatus Latescibacteria bacterium]|nr:iron-sulfur cluster repair di-iron protein [Candidatus Latescibacterota bacterium]